MKTYTEAPNRANLHDIDLDKSVFLAGSTTGARDWQKDATNILLPHFDIFNPRRVNYVWSEAEELTQIVWEDYHLSIAPITLFYFSHETLAPITLFELGKMTERLRSDRARGNRWRKIYISIHPEYKRKNDVIIQSGLLDFSVKDKIRFTLEETCDLIIKENK